MSELTSNEMNDISNGINPMQRIRYASLSGRSARKFKRKNTVHLRAECPACGGEMRWKKDIFITQDKILHNVWVCRKCRKALNRENLDNVKYV